MEDLLSPLAHYLVVAVGLAACLYQFVSLKRELWKQRREVKKLAERLDRALGHMGEEIEHLRCEMQETAMEAGPARLHPSMNLSMRSRALRMHRHGDRPDQIAAALGIPRNEVDLLLKVHLTVLEPPASEPDVGAHRAAAGPV